MVGQAHDARSVSPLSTRRSGESPAQCDSSDPQSVDLNETRQSGSLVEPQIKDEIDDEINDRERSRSLYSRIFTDSWAAELIAWFLAALSTLLIVIILVIFDNKRLSQWHSRITVNTLINFASQFAQTSLMVPLASSLSQMKWIWYRRPHPLANIEDFDKASRQPLDSLLLAYKHPKCVMVYVATLTSILILLLGPFAQQAVNIVNRQTVVANDTADIPFVEHWAGPLHQSILKTDAGVEGVGIPYASTDPGVNNNVLRGILGPDASHSDVKPVCLGANCTIPSYTTLGICSSTEDFKSHIIVQKGDGSNGETNYTIDELVAHPPLRGRPFDTSRVHVGMSAYPDSRSKAQQIWSRPYTNPDPKVLSEFYVMYPYKSYTEAPKDLLASVGASKVTLEYCLYTLQTEVRNGQTNTTVIDVIIEDLDWQWRGSSSNRSAFTTHTIGSNTTEYSASEAMKDALNTYMASEILYGSWLMTSGFDAAESDVALAIGKSLYHNNSGELTFDGWEGIDRLTDNLAISITNAMRTTADYSNLAVGTVSYTEIFIKVNFFWLILPIAAVLWVLMFLVIVIIQSKRAGIPAWKTSQLQAMQVLEPGVRDGLRLDKDEGAKMRVRLVTGEEGWLLGKNTDERSDEGVEMDLLGQ